MERNMIAGTNAQKCEDYIDGLIGKQAPLLKVLRLLCLYSITNGIKSKRFEFIKRELIQTYGYEHMFTLHNLEKMGLFNKPVKKVNWPAIRKQLRLTQPQTDLKNPSDIAYVYRDYAPLSVRLVEIAHQPGWKRIDEFMHTMLPGRTFEAAQPMTASLKQRYMQRKQAAAAAHKSPVTLVYFIGGATFAEISALRYLSKQSKHNRRYICATTKLINGSTFMDSLVEHVANNLKKSSMKIL
jgi:hypothetical protein